MHFNVYIRLWQVLFLTYRLFTLKRLLFFYHKMVLLFGCFCMIFRHRDVSYNRTILSSEREYYRVRSFGRFMLIR